MNKKLILAAGVAGIVTAGGIGLAVRQSPPVEAPARSAAHSLEEASQPTEDAPGLEAYWRNLDDTNSDVYVVAPGDNLTRIGAEYGVTAGAIQRSNRLTGDTIWPGMKLRIMTEPWNILIDKSQNLLSLKAGESIVKVYPVATGTDDTTTPVGDFTIVNRLVNPAWYYEGKKIPPLDPENPLGTRWLGFDLEHYGIHGTNDPDIIGKHATLGCVRMRNQDVEEVFMLVSVGTPVTVIR